MVLPFNNPPNPNLGLITSPKMYNDDAWYFIANAPDLN